MNNRGFVFVETIVVIVILTGSLLLLYSSFNNVLETEKTRINYDDIAYIYRTHYIKEQLKNLNIDEIINNLNNDPNKYFTTIGIETTNLFTNHLDSKTFITNLLNTYSVKQMILLKENKVEDLKKCNYNCANDNSCKVLLDCNYLYTTLPNDMINYLKTLYIDIECDYILVVMYEDCLDNKCQYFYSWESEK